MNLSLTNTSKNFYNCVKTNSNCEMNLSSEYSAIAQCSIACCISSCRKNCEDHNRIFLTLPKNQKMILRNPRKAPFTTKNVPFFLCQRIFCNEKIFKQHYFAAIDFLVMSKDVFIAVIQNARVE